MQESTIKNLQATMKLHGFYDGDVDGTWGNQAHAGFYAMAEAAIHCKAHSDKDAVNKEDKPVEPKGKYSLSAKSLDRLKGVHPDLVKVVKRAIQITEMDFAVNEGLRTVEKQREYVNAGKSQTMKSNHLTGRAVDIVPTPDGGPLSWNWDHYYEMVKAMQTAAEELNVTIRWGGCWEIINGKAGNPKSWVNAYGARKRAAKQKAFTDGPHFELV